MLLLTLIQLYFFAIDFLSGIIFFIFSYVAGICTERGEMKSKVILAGDMKQLDAVVKSFDFEAIKLGQKTPLMEYISKQEAYKCTANHDYNPSLIVQLTENYRCHPKILEIASELLYENRLEAKAPKGYNLQFSEVNIPSFLWKM